MTDEMEWERRGVVYRRAKLALDLGQAPLDDYGHAGDLLGKGVPADPAAPSFAAPRAVGFPGSPCPLRP
ncbi:hypothetical protein [Nonomuraea typhae]|uniref:hypothetical protein n=1 Tax=Nonomuraea typhae TaxID=2603600 RepID=UPI0012FAB26F|nr:hypothetical protein [Nonomuraea typhae]